MAQKKLTKEVVVILLVIVAALVYLLLQNNEHTQYTLPKLENLDQKDLSRLLIEKSDGDVDLHLKDGSWVVSEKEYKTDKEKVQKAMDVVSSLNLAELISRSGNDALYDLTEDKRIRVSLYRGDELLRRFDVGKAAGSYRHTFVRLDGAKEVYQALGSFRSDLEYKVDDWRDKVVFRVDSNEISSLKMGSLDKEWEFTKNVTKTEAAAEAGADGPVPPTEAISWKPTVERKESVKKDAIDGILGKLNELRCDRYAPENTQAGEIAYQITIQASTPHTLTLYTPESEEATEILARSSQSPYLFYLSKWSADGLKKSESDLFDLAPKEGEKK